MNPFSTPVIAAAVLVSSPALWSSVTGQTRLDLGLSRFLVAVVLCWLALSFVAMLVGPPPARASAGDDAAGGGEQPGRQAQGRGGEAGNGSTEQARESAGRVR